MYTWWLIIILIYLLVLISYVLISHLIFGDKDKLNAIDGVFFGMASLITITILPVIR